MFTFQESHWKSTSIDYWEIVGLIPLACDSGRYRNNELETREEDAPTPHAREYHWIVLVSCLQGLLFLSYQLQ